MEELYFSIINGKPITKEKLSTFTEADILKLHAGIVCVLQVAAIKQDEEGLNKVIADLNTVHEYFHVTYHKCLTDEFTNRMKPT